MSSDLTFITNETGNELYLRFGELLKSTSSFDCLVGYFFVSGFYKLYPSLGAANRLLVRGQAG